VNTYCPLGTSTPFDCPFQFASSPSGSISSGACRCNPGYTGNNGGLCTACTIGKYGIGGPSPCISCLDTHSTSPALSVNASACICQAGYHGTNGGTCSACAIGKYSEVGGEDECINCPLGRYGSTTALTTSLCTNECSAGYWCSSGSSSPTSNRCRSNSTSPAGSSNALACTCVAGYTGNDGETCGACAVGTWKSSSGSSLCTSCNQYETSPSGSTSSSSCVCQAGYTFDSNSNSCVACAAATWKSSSGNHECTSCPLSSASPSASTSSTSCKCTQGYFGAFGGNCTACSIGTWSNSTSATTVATCRACFGNSTTIGVASSSLNDCQCLAGYTPGSFLGSCLPCNRGSYKSIIGSGACQGCPSSTQTTENIAATSISSCQCPAGSQSYSGYCSSCLPGTWSAGGTQLECSLCPAGRFGSTNGLTSTTCSGICSANYYCPAASTSATAVACPFLNSHSLAGSGNSSACLCNAGYSGSAGGFCSICPVNTYGNGGTSSCQACPSGSVSVAASTSISSCQCPIGYTPSGSSGACVACGNNMYKSVAGDASCTACPTYTGHSLTAATSILTCVCLPGYDYDGTLCVLITAPTVSVNIAADQVTPTAASSVRFIANFSRSITGFTTADVVIGGTSGASTASIATLVNGRVYTITISGMTKTGTIIASLDAGAAVDSSTGEASKASRSSKNVVDYDITKPAVTVEQSLGQADPTSLLPIYFTITFTKPVVSSNVAVNVSGSGTANAIATIATISSSSYVATITNVAPSALVTVSVPAGVTTDMLGNTNTASNSTDNAVVYDAVAPYVNMSLPSGYTRLRTSSSIVIMTFSKRVTLMVSPNAALTLTGSAVVGGVSTITLLSSVVSSYNATMLVQGLTVTSDLEATITTSVNAFRDGSGNGVASTSVTLIMDSIAPIVTIIPSSSTPMLTNHETVSFVLIWSESVLLGLTSTGIVVMGTSSTGTSVSILPLTSQDVPRHEVIVSGLTVSGNLTIAVIAGAVTDIAGTGNGYTIANFSIVFDNVPATLSLWSPVNGSITSTFLTISYTLDEVALPGSVVLSFERQSTSRIADASSPHIYKLSTSLSDSGSQLQFVMNGTSPYDGINVIAASTASGLSSLSNGGVSLVSDVSYIVQLSYRDMAGNIGVVQAAPFTFDITPPSIPSLYQPESYGRRGTPLQVQWQAFELVSYVTLTFVDISALDTHAPHIVTFNSTMYSASRHITYLPSILSEGNNVASVSSFPNDQLVDGATYIVILAIRDIAGNAISTMNVNFTYDIGTPSVPALLTPESYTYANGAIPFIFTLPESPVASSVMIIITRTGGSIDTDSPHVLTMSAAYESVGVQHSLIVDPLAISLASETVYSIRLEYRSSSSNKVAYSMANEWTFDNTPPLLPILTSPATNSAWPAIIAVNYTISEVAISGSVQLMIIDSAASTIMATVVLESWMETPGIHLISLPVATLESYGVASVNMSLPLYHNLIFDTKLSFADRAGNQVSAINTNIVLDLQAPTIGGFNSPVSNGLYGTTISFTFALTSIAKTGSVQITLTRASAFPSAAATWWTITLSSSMETIGAHSVTLITQDLASSTSVIEVHASNGWSSLTSSDKASLASGGVYDATLQFRNLPGIVTSVTATSLSIDYTPPSVPTIDCDATSANRVVITMTLPEDAYAGSVILTLTPTSSSIDSTSARVLVLSSALESSDTHTITLPCLSLSSGDGVANVTVGLNSLISGATYSLSLSYRDMAYNLATSTSTTLFTYDITAPLAATILAPRPASVFQPSWLITYSLPEDARSGSLKIRLSDNTATDVNAPHELILDASFSASGVIHRLALIPSLLSSTTGVISSTHQSSPSADVLKTGTTYNISIGFNDLAGNAAPLAETSGIRYSGGYICGARSSAPSNGIIGTCGSNITLHGLTCSYQCNSGFTLTGASLTCDNGTFTGADQTCQGNTCSALTDVPTNGDLSTCGLVIPHQVSCSISCNNGYTLIGGTTRTCYAGILSGQTQTCEISQLIVEKSQDPYDGTASVTMSMSVSLPSSMQSQYLPLTDLTRAQLTQLFLTDIVKIVGIPSSRVDGADVVLTLGTDGTTIGIEFVVSGRTGTIVVGEGLTEPSATYVGLAISTSMNDTNARSSALLQYYVPGSFQTKSSSPSSDDVNPIFAFLPLIVVCFTSVILFAICRVYFKRTRLDFVYPAIFAIFDVITDIIFIYYVAGKGPDYRSYLYTCITFISLPFIINVSMTLMILNRHMSRPEFLHWFQQSLAMGSLFTLLSGVNLNAFNVLQSNLFHRPSFRAPWNVELSYQIRIGGVISLVVSSVPQLVIQSLVVNQASFSNASLLSISTSIFSILFGLTQRAIAYLMRKAEKKNKNVTLPIAVTSNSGVISKPLIHDALTGKITYGIGEGPALNTTTSDPTYLSSPTANGGRTFTEVSPSANHTTSLNKPTRPTMELLPDQVVHDESSPLPGIPTLTRFPSVNGNLNGKQQHQFGAVELAVLAAASQQAALELREVPMFQKVHALGGSGSPLRSLIATGIESYHSPERGSLARHNNNDTVASTASTGVATTGGIVINGLGVDSQLGSRISTRPSTASHTFVSSSSSSSSSSSRDHLISTTQSSMTTTATPQVSVVARSLVPTMSSAGATPGSGSISIAWSRDPASSHTAESVISPRPSRQPVVTASLSSIAPLSSNHIGLSSSTTGAPIPIPTANYAPLIVDQY
jgi:hypothetical protein